MNAKEHIARRVALEFQDGAIVNLGIGLPTMVANYIPTEIDITLQSENGFLGIGPLTEPDPDLVNAGGQSCGMLPGAMMFDSSFSFALIRGGHVDFCVLGGLEVDEKGDLANWTVPGKMFPGMGGAMDLVVGSKRVVVAMKHCTKDGKAKILHKCALPLTAVDCVSLIITELCVFEFVNGELVLQELAEGVTVDDIKARTEATFTVSDALKTMPLSQVGLS